MKMFSTIAILMLILTGCAKRAVVPEPTTTQQTSAEQTTAKTEQTLQDTQKTETQIEAVQVEKITEQEITQAAVMANAVEKTTKQEIISGENYIERLSAPCSQSRQGKATFENAYFDFDSYSIRDDAKPALNELSSWLAKNDLKITVEGHCDERGTNEYNLALGDQRAGSIKDYLLSIGITSNRIDTISCGEEAPVCTEQAEECWGKNRRAHFVIIERADGNTN